MTCLSQRSEATIQRNESAREPSGDQTAVSERTSYQPGTAYILLDSPIINHVDKVTPGYGLPNPHCGTVGSRSIRAQVVCPEDPAHYKRAIFDDCHRPACPVCWSAWADRAAERNADTVMLFKETHNYPYFPNHIDITPDPAIVPFDRPTKECLDWLMEEVNSRLDVLGVVAASVIAHPYRIRDEYKRYVNDEASKAGCNRYVWALAQPDWYNLVYFSPHVHALIYGKLLKSPEFYRLTGWQYHNHGRLSSRTDVIKVLKYLLSHAWVRGNSKTIRNLRGMSSTKLLVTQVKDRQPDLCPVCRAHNVRLPYWGVDAYGNEIQPFQTLKNADKAYRVVMIRTGRAKETIAEIRDRAWAAAAVWWRRYYRDHHLFFGCALLPVTA